MSGPVSSAVREWVVVVPVKPAVHGKSRLGLPGAAREAVARAIALDTVEAAAGCARVARVVVVTGDQPLIRELAGQPRVKVLADTTAGLRPAIALGLDAVGTEVPRAVLLGDLPGLRPQELAAALEQAGDHERAHVPDADGSGTVLATVVAGAVLVPLFGPDSRRAHLDAGSVELDLPATWGLRRDLDTSEHLALLRSAGLGRHTTAVIG